MRENLYNEVPYETITRVETHPDRLATVGRLYGMKPAPVERCRYLEIGCGDGTSVIAMAHYLPESRFVGVDLAEAPIVRGNRMRQELALGNLELRTADLCAIGAEWGEFDYIVAHGVYSWVPVEVRDALLRVCRERLAPEGIAFISYNALPGRHARQYLRDLMRYHTRRIQDPARRLEAARACVRSIADSPGLSEEWRQMLRHEAEVVLSLSDATLLHDDFSTFYEPVYFHQFMAHAAGHRLQYLGEADLPEMFDPRGLLDGVPCGLLEREQYMDFLKARRFRQTLLCRQECALTRPPLESVIDGFLVSSLTRSVEGGQIEGLRRVRITPVQEVARNVAAALGEVYPLPLGFEELVPYAGSEAALRDILAGMVMTGFADLHSYDFPCQETVTARPVANRLVRYQAARSRRVTSTCFRSVDLDEVGHNLLRLLDGSRDFDRLAADLSQTSGAPPIDEIRRHLPSSLEWMARMGLLEA